jgi:hypothetical protein
LPYFSEIGGYAVISISLPDNVVTISCSLVCWGIIGFLIWKRLQQSEHQLIWWKAVIVTVVGLSVFRLGVIIAGEMIKIPVFPLGVWLLNYLYSGKLDEWEKYRWFAWLGFSASFLFLAATLLAIPIHSLIYPQNEPATYLANMNDAAVTAIHPAGEDVTLNVNMLRDSLAAFSREEVQMFEWYEQMQSEPDPQKRKERFPYLLTGVKPKWGSGIPTLIYLEEDGKGILITTPKKQLYFRSQQALVEGM